jgi:hypothetical protein
LQSENHAHLSEKAAELIAAIKDQPATVGHSASRGRASTPPGGDNVKVLAAILGVVVVVGVVLLTLSLLPRDKAIPDELVGVWRTEAASHADRGFEIQKTSVRFQIDETVWTTHTILEVERDQGDSGVNYVIHHDAEGDEALFAFVYFEAPDPLIQFANQRYMDWYKVEDQE